jgi:type I restriction enzyme M protein
MVAAMQPGPDDTICDPAAGTGGFLLSAHDYVVKHHPKLNPDQMKHVKEDLIFACELVPTTARLCAMNLHLHGIGGKSLCATISGSAPLTNSSTSSNTSTPS